mgnify:CR=1 FL=1
MIKGKKILAIVPARGGSKRLPRKNLLPLAGKPMILWSLEAGIKSKYIDKIVVTSDDSDTIKISRKLDIHTIVRPKKLATDEATTYSAIKHVLENIDDIFDLIILLQPTSPLRNETHIDKALEFLDQKKADAVISVCEMLHNPLRANTLPEDKSMAGFLKKDRKGKRSQNLPKFFTVNGGIYICRKENYLAEKTFLINKNIFAFLMDRVSSVDIDEKEDFMIAETFMSNLLNSY